MAGWQCLRRLKVKLGRATDPAQKPNLQHGACADSDERIRLSELSGKRKSQGLLVLHPERDEPQAMALLNGVVTQWESDTVIAVRSGNSKLRFNRIAAELATDALGALVVALDEGCEAFGVDVHRVH